MKTSQVNKLGRNGLIGCTVGSCILFQLMFCGLFYLMPAMAVPVIPDWVYASASRETLLYFSKRINEAESSIALLCLFCMLSLVLHLGLICFFALRRECAEPAQKPSAEAEPEAESV